MNVMGINKINIAKAIAEQVLTVERLSHGDVKVRVSNRKGYDIRAQQTPLDLYYNKRFLGSDSEIASKRFAAGNKFYRDFYIAGMTPGMTIDFNRVYSFDKREFLPATESQREALDRWREAYQNVHGVIGKMLAVNVCCYGYMLSDIEIRYYRRGRDAFPRFLEMLDDLVIYYSI